MTDLSSEQIGWLGKHLAYSPASAKGGRPKASQEDVLRGIFWVLDHGATWHDLPEGYGAKSTVHRWFQHWAQEGALHALLGKFGKAQWEDEGNVLYEVTIKESGFKKAEQVKLFVVVDEQGLPVLAARHGQAHPLKRKKLVEDLRTLVACLEKMESSSVDLSDEVGRLGESIEAMGSTLVPLRVPYQQRLTKFGEVRPLKRLTKHQSAERVLHWLKHYRSLCSRWDMSTVSLPA